MLGRYASDLEVGDVLGPVEYEMTPFMARELAHAVEDASETWHGASGAVAMPTSVHADKKRLLELACPEGAGPAARLHLEYDATNHRPIPVGSLVVVQGEVVDRFEHNGRERVKLVIEVRDRRTGALFTSYRDLSTLSFKPSAS